MTDKQKIRELIQQCAEMEDYLNRSRKELRAANNAAVAAGLTIIMSVSRDADTGEYNYTAETIPCQNPS